MTELDELRVAQSAAYSSIMVAVAAVERLMVERQSLPKLVAAYRASAPKPTEDAVVRFASALYPTEPELARLLLGPLSGTRLGVLFLDHGRELINRYRV